MQIEAKSADEEEVDIFDQIDQMDALIRAEEEAAVAENEETAASTSPVKQFVAEMVDRMIGYLKKFFFVLFLSFFRSSFGGNNGNW